MIDTKIKTLLKVYEAKNYTKAAAELNLTQPAVSQHIKALEDELGVKIFLRTPTDLKLSREGEIVVKYAKRMLQLYKNLNNDLKNEKNHVKELTIGITHTAESNASAEALAKYALAHNNVKIKIITDTKDNLCKKIKSYEIDLAIIEGRVLNSRLKSIMLDTDSLVLALSIDNPLAKKNMVTIDELKKEKLILRSSKSGTGSLFLSTLGSQNLSIYEFNKFMEIDNIQTIKDLVRRGFGVSVLAKSACMDEYQKKKIALVPIENLSMVREVNIVYAEDFAHEDVIKDIISYYNKTINGSSN